MHALVSGKARIARAHAARAGGSCVDVAGDSTDRKAGRGLRPNPGGCRAFLDQPAARARSERLLERIIGSYERAIEAARRDLAHVNATLQLFERDGVTTALQMSTRRKCQSFGSFAVAKSLLFAGKLWRKLGSVW